MWQQFRRDVHRVSQMLAGGLRRLKQGIAHRMEKTLEVRQPNSRIRGVLFRLYQVGVWVVPFMVLRPRPWLGIKAFFFNPKAWLIAVSLWMPVYWARRLAAFYLDDVYELSLQIQPDGEPGTVGVWVAERFIQQAAFAWTYSETLFIEEAQVTNPTSPVFLIGGPGRVVVGMESAVLLERPDGTPIVLGPMPSTDEKGRPFRGYPIEGFVRLRRIVDLREHTATFDLEARSRDGVPVRVEQVRMLYHIYRGRRQPTHRQPYPFMPMAVQRLVYSERGTVRLQSDEHASADAVARRRRSAQHITDAMRSLARGELRRFIQSQTLDEFLAAIGEREEQAYTKRREELEEEAPEVVKALQTGTPLPDKPAFVPRHVISARFQRFTERQGGEEAPRARGVSLSWIDIGAWEVPVRRVQEQVLRAWQIARENARRGAPEVLNRIAQEAYVSVVRARLRELTDEFAALRQQEVPWPRVLRELAAHYSAVLRQYLAQARPDDEWRSGAERLLRWLEQMGHRPEE